jgi:glycine/D-amino acid oxidase-like deaminating enzyme
MPEIVIVGGGVIGASIAYHLAAKGARDVLLLERGTLGGGETHKSGGFVQTHWQNPHEVRLIAYAREVFRAFGERVGGDCGWVAGGYLHVTGAAREPAVREVHAMLQAGGLESQWLAPGELARLVPGLAIDDLVGGAYEPASGWASSLATTRAFADAARRHGATIRESVTVQAIEHAGGRVTGVATSDGAIAAPVVILAAGPWTSSLHLGEPLPITIERGQVTYVDGAVCGVGFYDEVTGLYTHPDGGGSLVGIDWPFEHVTADAYDRELSPPYVAAALAKLAHRFPGAAGAAVVRGHVGLYDFTPDGQPIVDGPLGLAGYYVAAGFSGVGFKSSPATGLGMAELVLDGKATTVAIDHLRAARFATPTLPELLAKLQAVRAQLAPAEQAKLLPFVMALGPEQLRAIGAAVSTRPIDELAAWFRAQLA